MIDFSRYEFPVTIELDVPAGVEVQPKAPHYINSVSVNTMLYFDLALFIYTFTGHAITHLDQVLW